MIIIISILIIIIILIIRRALAQGVLDHQGLGPVLFNC